MGYERKSKTGDIVPLLKRPGLQMWDRVTVPTSMREVESSVRLIMNKRKLTPGEQNAISWTHQESDVVVNGDEEVENG